LNDVIERAAIAGAHQSARLARAVRRSTERR
jgi:hypothetical protein